MAGQPLTDSAGFVSLTHSIVHLTSTHLTPTVTIDRGERRFGFRFHFTLSHHGLFKDLGSRYSSTARPSLTSPDPVLSFTSPAIYTLAGASLPSSPHPGSSCLRRILRPLFSRETRVLGVSTTDLTPSP
jgi:hypothetical protein